MLANLTPESRNICLLVLCLNSFGCVIFVFTAVVFSVVLWCFVVAGFGMCRSQDCYLSTSCLPLTLHFKGFLLGKAESFFLFFFSPLATVDGFASQKRWILIFLVFLYGFLGKGCCWEGHKFACQSIAVSSCHFICYCKVHLSDHRIFTNKKKIKIEMSLGLIYQGAYTSVCLFMFFLVHIHVVV